MLSVCFIDDSQINFAYFVNNVTVYGAYFSP